MRTPLCSGRPDAGPGSALPRAGGQSRQSPRARAPPAEFPGFPYLGLWHCPHTAAPYVCIEPWCSLPSRQDLVEDLSDQPSLLRLPSGETLRREIIFTFD